jgi:CheY-like chemotaxis protein
MIALQKSDEEQERTAEGEVLSGRRILVAEDGPDNQRLVRHFLEKAGANVEIADNGRIAVDRVSNDASYDAILMDVQMPEMDGHEATRRIREMRYRGPVIALTAHALKEEREAILAAGCDDFLTKPIVRPTLIETIVRWTDRDSKLVTDAA